MLKKSWFDRVNMAPIKHGLSMLYITAVVATLVVCLPYLLGRGTSAEQIKSALSKLSIIHGAAEDPKFTVSCQALNLVAAGIRFY